MDFLYNYDSIYVICKYKYFGIYNGIIFSKKQNYSPIAATLGTTDGKSEGEIVEGTDDDVTEEGTDDDDGATVDGEIVGL